MSQQVRTDCRICEAACGLIAELDEEGKVKRLKPDRDHPVSRGFGCAKGTRFAETASGAHRVLTPAVRRDGQWQPHHDRPTSQGGSSQVSHWGESGLRRPRPNSCHPF